jgi:hypothetical protein
MDLDRVGGVGEAVLGGDARGPLLDRGSLDLHGPAAVPAQQVVVVVLDGAATVHRLVVPAAQHVHEAVVGHGLQDPVGRGEGDRLATIVEQAVEFLCADEIVEVVERGAHGTALARDALRTARTCRCCLGCRLRRHVLPFPAGTRRAWTGVKIISAAAGNLGACC